MPGPGGRATRKPTQGVTMTKIVRCLEDERGATAVECGLVAGAIAASIIFASRLFGDGLAELLFAVSHGF